jgi:heavy metal sensor kinase
MTLPFQTRLILFCTLTFALLLAVVGVVSYRFLAKQLDLDATAELNELTTGLHGYLRFENGRPSVAYDDKDDNQAAFVHKAARYFQIYDGTDGRLLMRSEGIEPLGLQLTLAEAKEYLERPESYDIQTAHGRFRISNSVISPSAGGRYLLQVAASLDPMDTARQRYLELLLALALPTVLATLLVVAWVARRTMAPLNVLATEARRVSIDTLHHRLPLRGTGDQLDQVTAAFNETLANLEGAVGEMRQFSSALAHELRTPLSALRGEIELSLLHPTSEHEWRANAVSQIEEIDKLTRLANQLLTLARAESGDIPLARDGIDLAALATTVTEQLEPVAQAGDVTLRCVIQEPTLVTGDRGWLERLLLNLLDNAMKYTPAGGNISVTVSREAGEARIDVRDSGIGISIEALPRIFERFYRADPSRTSADEGAGLGLSLARWIVDRHRGRIEVKSELGRGSIFTVWLPASAFMNAN